MIDAIDGRSLSHARLAERLDREAALWPARKGLALVAAAPRLDRVCRWLSLMRAGHAVMLVPPELTPARLDRLVERYRPDWLLGWPSRPGYADLDAEVQAIERPDPRPLHDDLCLLLSTSGSSGAPRMVRLSRRAVAANATSIAQALALTPQDCVATTLPLSYSYGLSLLHSHLAAGATVVLSGQSVLERGFWDMAGQYGLTFLAGVPFVWQSLRRLDLDALAPASLRFATQAGGRLDPRLIEYFHTLMARRGGGLFTMYGQTEATARMTVLPPDQVPVRLGSVGRPIPGGRITIRDGVVVYGGDNVMMGYGESRNDLGRGDELAGVLDTGDYGRLDGDGYVWLEGRAGRVVKVMGLRLDLDEVQARAALFGSAAALVRGMICWFWWPGRCPIAPPARPSPPSLVCRRWWCAGGRWRPSPGPATARSIWLLSRRWSEPISRIWPGFRRRASLPAPRRTGRCPCRANF